MATMDQILADMPDNQSTLCDVVQNILDEPIPEAVKERLFKPLQPGKYRPSPPKKDRKRKAIEEEFDPNFLINSSGIPRRDPGLLYQE